MKKFSVLEYLHPDGIARSSLVLGSNCPEILRPELQQRFDGKADLFILAPSLKESYSQTWLGTAVQRMSADLSADGIGYILVPPRFRWKVKNLLRSAGLVIGEAFWHFPNWSSSRYLIPVERFPGQFAAEAIVSAPSLKRTLAMQMFQHSGTRQFINNVSDHVGISVRRRGARPLFQWIFQDGDRSLSGSAILRRSWRELNGASIAYGFSGPESVPSVIVKTIAAEKTSQLSGEAKVLENLGDEARRAGVQIPRIIGRQQNDQYSSLRLSFIPGQPVSDLLVLKPDEFLPLMTRIVDWLGRWHHATLTSQPFTREQFEQAILLPLNQLAPLIQNVELYQHWLMALGETAVGNPAPFVAAHNDLTMANILLDEHNQTGVVDWETGCREGLPLVDFYYAVADAVRIAAKCSNWLDAFKACYLLDGFYSAKTVAWREQLQSSIGCSPGFAELSFHACWLHHASNEHKTSQPGEPRPFLDIVQWLALHESNFN